ncbi:MAG: recombination protein RecR [Parcubacteria group bacterium Gr01-1014_17]|nr:MAG: recombination protein RecR [Parcubacteria group bacterium Gr01-1014_17]
MDTLHELTELFRAFPGVGPRQAKRFVHHLLLRGEDAENLSSLALKLRKNVTRCELCRRFFAKDLPLARAGGAQAGGAFKKCRICRDEKRDKSALLVVARDIDLEAVEKSGSFRGYYFVLGGTIPILDTQPEKRVALKELLARVEKSAAEGLKEIVLALSANPEGEHTAEIVAYALETLSKKYNIKLSVLGRGLSTGTELEYCDAETLKSALKNRQ